jgi:hypothetical protein
MARKKRDTVALDSKIEALQQEPRFEEAQVLMEQIRQFFNVAFQRRLVGGWDWLECLIKALKDGYTPGEIRVAYWVARCLPGKSSWLATVLRDGGSPLMVLRHDGGINPVTGVPAKRWLDDLLMRRMEVSAPMVQMLYNNLPPELKESEREIIALMGVKLDGE